ncbi:hypothetical protein [uncultured Nostoc sp.]|uniref:hypothetical protein n=1 Tax=uncultured Nostoc sp. TaxID=340711 RepID=UPI0035C9CB1E
MKIPLRHLISLFLLGILIFISVSVCSSISLQVKNSNFQQPSTECRVVKHSMGETNHPKYCQDMAIMILGI